MQNIYTIECRHSVALKHKLMLFTWAIWKLFQWNHLHWMSQLARRERESEQVFLKSMCFETARIQNSYIRMIRREKRVIILLVCVARSTRNTVCCVCNVSRKKPHWMRHYHECLGKWCSDCVIVAVARQWQRIRVRDCVQIHSKHK